MRLARSSPRILIAFGLLLIMSSILALYAGNADTGKSQSKFDNELYNSLMSQRLESLDDLIVEYEYQQLDFMPVLPPGPDGTLQQETGVYAFDPAGFPVNFAKGLVPDYSLDVASFPVWIYQEPETLNRIVINSKGTELASLPPPADYVSDWFLLEAYPLLDSGKYSPETVALTKATFDPSRLIVGLRLIAKKDVAAYVSVLSQKADSSLTTGRGGGGIGPMMMYTGAPVSHVQFTAIERLTNSIRVTLAYPATYTNRLEIFTCSDLVPSWYACGGTTNINPGTNWVEWTDTSGTWTNFSPRFYAAGNADLDTDGDTLTDAREFYMYHTSATTNDSDNDGLSDYQELMVLNTDPNNNDTNKPVVTITYPTNNFSWEWLP
jgi:hypothetical protein